MKNLKQKKRISSGFWLREQERNSNAKRLIFQIKIEKSSHGRTVVVVNREKAGISLLPHLFELLCKTVLMSQIKGSSNKRGKINYSELAATYRELINSGVCKNQAELSRYLGVSRAWVTKVLNSKL